MPTPHISAQPGDFAPAVIMPGDPKRAARMAAELMPDARLVTDVRNICGYTGTYEGKPLSIMASGMGQPSASIYATELFSFYGVERIIRVGTAGGLSPKVKAGDVVIAIGAHTDSVINTTLCPGIQFSATASWNLLKAAVTAIWEQYGGEFIHFEEMGDTMRAQCAFAKYDEELFHDICEDIAPHMDSFVEARLLFINKDLETLHIFTISNGRWQECCLSLPDTGPLGRALLERDRQ